MASWMEDQISDADEGDDVESKSSQEMTKQIQTMLATDTVEKLSVSLLRERISEVEDTEVLESALESEERENACEVYRNRLEELGEFNNDESTSESNESGSDTDEEEDTETEPDPFGDSDDSEDSTEEESSENDDADEEEGREDSDDTGTPTDNESEEDTDSSSSSNIDVKQIAPDVMTADDAAEKDRRFSMLVWSDPGMGKTHFACSSPDPVVIIDTEGKADEVARKFRGEGRVAESPFLFQPTDYDEAIDAMNSALDILDEYRVKADMTGTLVVDSMSVMWGWSQQKYVDKFYPGKDAEEVEFSSAIGGGQSDWKQIKRYHNVKFRQVMLDSPYHLVWTAMREDDYEERMKGNRDADKPAGEKENPYKVDEVLRIQEGSDGAPVGVLNKSGKIKHRYAGLRYPTFDKHRDTIDAILEAERGSRSIESVAGEIGIRVHEGNPEFKDNDDE
jgi:hypothetical protein